MAEKMGGRAPMKIIHQNRTTKRGPDNARPEDPFKTEAEVTMDAVKTMASMDGRNPGIQSGKSLPSGFDVPQGG